MIGLFLRGQLEVAEQNSRLPKLDIGMLVGNATARLRKT
jgi:hypothetical protein